MERNRIRKLTGVFMATFSSAYGKNILVTNFDTSFYTAVTRGAVRVFENEYNAHT